MSPRGGKGCVSEGQCGTLLAGRLTDSGLPISSTYHLKWHINNALFPKHV